MNYYNFFARQNVTFIGDKLVQLSAFNKYKFINNIIKDNSKALEILEIGPGRGTLANIFVRNEYSNYDIVEPNDCMRGKLLNSGIRSAKKYSIPKLNENNASYDLIILSHVFEHLQDINEVKLFIIEVKRVLKNGGYIFIASPDINDWGFNFWNGDYTHSNPTTVRRTAQLFFDAEITTLAYKYYYSGLEGFLGFIISRVIKVLTFFIKGEGLNSKLWKLRTSFLRSFMIIGQIKEVP